MTRLSRVDEISPNHDDVQTRDVRERPVPPPRPRNFHRPVHAITGDTAADSLENLTEGDKEELCDLVHAMCRKFAPLMEVFMTARVPDVEKIDRFAIKLWGNKTRDVPIIQKIRSLHILQNSSFKKDARQWLHKSSRPKVSTSNPLPATTTGEDDKDQESDLIDSLPEPPRTPCLRASLDSDDHPDVQRPPEVEDDEADDTEFPAVTYREGLEARLQRLLNGTRSLTMTREQWYKSEYVERDDYFTSNNCQNSTETDRHCTQRASLDYYSDLASRHRKRMNSVGAGVDNSNSMHENRGSLIEQRASLPDMHQENLLDAVYPRRTWSDQQIGACPPSDVNEAHHRRSMSEHNLLEPQARNALSGWAFIGSPPPQPPRLHEWIADLAPGNRHLSFHDPLIGLYSDTRSTYNSTSSESFLTAVEASNDAALPPDG